MLRAILLVTHKYNNVKINNNNKQTSLLIIYLDKQRWFPLLIMKNTMQMNIFNNQNLKNLTKIIFLVTKNL
jgi:hypothetical protein